MAKANISALFLDVGGVLLTNGWGRNARQRAVEKFGLDVDELDERHHLTFDTYEEGKLDLDEYLARVVFYERRPFTPEEFKAFMFAQSKPLPGAIDFFRELKAGLGLRVVAVSNEGCEITKHRIQEFKLGELFDAFIASCFVHFRKPDKDIFRIALDVSQASPDQTVYIDDRLMFVEVAASLGLRGIHHVGLDTTRARLAEMGVVTETG